MARVDTVTLVNLVSETRTVPEFIGADCRADRIAPALDRLLRGDPGRDAQTAAMAETMQRLGLGGEPPGLRAARSVLQVLGVRGALPPQERTVQG
jgi:lipid-A-disaccharide synthase